MSDFLDQAERLRRTADVDVDAFDLVFRGVDELQVVHSKAVLDTDNVESVMSAFEMAALVGRLGRLEGEEVAKLPQAITKLSGPPSIAASRQNSDFATVKPKNTAMKANEADGLRLPLNSSNVRRTATCLATLSH